MKRSLDCDLLSIVQNQLYITEYPDDYIPAWPFNAGSVEIKKIEGNELKIEKGSLLELYLQGFINDYLQDEPGKEFYNYETHLLEGLSVLHERYTKIGKKFTLSKEETFNDKKFLFLHFIFVLTYYGYIRTFETRGLPLPDCNFEVYIEVMDSFIKLYDLNRAEIERYDKNKPKNKNLISLKAKEVSFDDSLHIIKVGNYKSILPPFKNEHDLCRVMFDSKNEKGKSIDWSIVYKEISGTDPFGDQIKKLNQRERTIQDTVYKVNERLKRDIPTSDDLFTWQNKTVTRNF